MQSTFSWFILKPIEQSEFSWIGGRKDFPDSTAEKTEEREEECVKRNVGQVISLQAVTWPRRAVKQHH